MPPTKPGPKSSKSPKGREDTKSSSQHSDPKHEHHHIRATHGETAVDMHETDMVEDNIEADAEIEAEIDFDTLLGDDEFIVTDSTDFVQVQRSSQESALSETPLPKEESKDRYVIPKLKCPASESVPDKVKGKRDSDDARRDRDKSRRDRSEKSDGRHHEKEDMKRGRDSHNGHAAKESPKIISQSRSFTDAFKLKGRESRQDPEAVNMKKEPEEKIQQPGVSESTSEDPQKEVGEQEEEDENKPLVIPEGRDNIASVHGLCPWQIRIYPVSRSDVTRPEFAQLWAIADSSAIAWSTIGDAGGVAEFLLQKRDSIQKFMRKALFHAYSNQSLTVEISERASSDKSKGDGAAEQEGDSELKLVNKVIFRYNNRLAKQLIKTFYPTAKGEMTERSLYVNNIGPGVSTDLMKAIFPCSLKIGVAKASKDMSLALVETESADAAFNYLVVYDQITINGRDLVLSTSEYDWQGAHDKYYNKGQKTAPQKPPTKGEKPGAQKSPARGEKRPSSSSTSTTTTTTTTSEPASKKERRSSPPPNRGHGGGGRGGGGRGSPSPSKGRGGRGSPPPNRGRGGGRGASRGSSRGRGASSPRGGPAGRGLGRGRGLLPDPVGRSEGLLPLPGPLPPPPQPPSLLSLPTAPPSNPALVAETEFLLAQEEHERRTAELQEVRHQLESQVMETRANLVMAARRAEAQAVAQLQNRLSLLDRMQHVGTGGRPAAGDYYAEEEPQEARRSLLRREDLQSEAVPDWPREQPEFSRPRPPATTTSAAFEPRTYPHEEEYAEPGRRSVDDHSTSAQLVLIALFNLNPPEFSLMLAALPKAFQDGATKILHSHMRSASESTSDVLSPRNATSPPAEKQRSRPPSRQSLGQPEDFETENMNPEDIYNSIKKTSADIQNLSLGTKLDGYDDIKKKREFASQDSGIQELRNDSPDAVDGRRGHQHTYNPHQYQDDANALNGFNKSGRDNGEASYDKGVTIPDILRELSNHNERVRERRKMLDSLLKMVRNNAISKEQWDEHFKSILLILIETFGDSDKSMRMDALIVFRSILKRQPARFRDYAELTILKVCEAHKDPSKDIGGLSDLNSDEQVQRAAEECALVIPTAINPEQALPILNSIIQTAKFPIHWAAIKMQVEVVKLVPSEVLIRALPDTVPGLLTGYDDSDSRVRKAAVFCLVNIYMQVGEALRPYLSDLNSSKTKLLNLYIKRAQEDSKSGIMSPIASDT